MDLMTHIHPIHIVKLYRFAFMGGAELNSFTTMSMLRERGFRFTVICPGGGRLAAEARQRGFSVHEWRLGPNRADGSLKWVCQVIGSMIRSSFWLKSFCERNEVDLIHAHGPITATACMTVARNRRIPVLVHIHDAQPPKRTYRAAVGLLKGFADLFMCVSRASQAVVTSMGIPEDRTVVAYNGLSSKMLSSRYVPEPSVVGPGPHIGVVAHLYELKGQKIFLQAAQQIVRTFPTAMFYLIGESTFEDGDAYRAELNALADSPELNGHVIFAGYQPNPLEWMAAMDAVASTSILPEALPTVLLEAMSIGKLVVGTNIGGTVEIIRDGETGFLVPPSDPTALARTLVAMLELPPDNEIGCKAADDVRLRFSPEAFADSIEAVYVRLLSKRDVPSPDVH